MVRGVMVAYGVEVVRLYEAVRSSEGRCEGEGGCSVEIDVGGVCPSDDVAFEVEAPKEEEDKDGPEDWVRWRRRWRRRGGGGRGLRAAEGGKGELLDDGVQSEGEWMWLRWLLFELLGVLELPELIEMFEW